MVKRSRRGFTLMEVVVTMSIFGVFLLIIGTLTLEMRGQEKRYPINFMQHPQVISVLSRLARAKRNRGISVLQLAAGRRESVREAEEDVRVAGAVDRVRRQSFFEVRELGRVGPAVDDEGVPVHVRVTMPMRASSARGAWRRRSSRAGH